MADPKPANAPKAAAAAGASGLTFESLPTIGKVGVGVALCVLIGGIYYFALHSPLNDDLEAARARNRTLATDMEAAQQRQREYIELREELASREGMDRANLRVLPADPEIPAFLADLHRLAENSGLEMRLVQPQPEEPSEHYVEVPVELRFAGRYHQLARFFYNVSRLERAISMENVHLATPRLVGEDVVLTVEVMATTYRRPNDADAAPTDGRAAGAPPASGGKP
jgi:type IV pilus assembly protein PilO